MNSWIKMRSEILRSPRLVAIARLLGRSQGFRAWLFPKGGNGISESALRCVTGALLMRVWSDARSFGNFDGDDLFVPHFSIPDIDLWADAPGVGKAMLAVGWLQVRDSDGEQNGLVFPNFRQYNAPLEPAEKQSNYRKRKKESVTKVLPSGGNAALPLEKRREEKSINTPVAPFSPLDFELVTFPGADYDTRDIRQMLQEWCSVRAKAHGALSDPELAITRALQLFGTPKSLIHNLRRAISGQWKNLAPREEPPKHDDQRSRKTFT